MGFVCVVVGGRLGKSVSSGLNRISNIIPGRVLNYMCVANSGENAVFRRMRLSPIDREGKCGRRIDSARRRSDEYRSGFPHRTLSGAMGNYSAVNVFD